MMTSGQPQGPKECRRFIPVGLEILRDHPDDVIEIRCRIPFSGNPASSGEGHEELFTSEALGRSVEQSEIVLLENHNLGYLLARTRNESLKVSVEGGDLLVQATLVDEPFTRDLAADIRDGLFRHVSVCYGVIRDRWEEQEDGRQRRIIEEAHLHDISIESTAVEPDATEIEADELFHTYESEGP